ncbi:unnamed protein product, partial [Hapterophycus canaliculatus]
GAISAGHDRSDGGLASLLLEMAFAGEVGCGLDVDVPAAGEDGVLGALFSEEVWIGPVFRPSCREPSAAVRGLIPRHAKLCAEICFVLNRGIDDGSRSQVSIKVGGEEGVTGTTAGLRGVWEATSFQLERLQCDPACVEQE